MPVQLFGRFVHYHPIESEGLGHEWELKLDNVAQHLNPIPPPDFPDNPLLTTSATLSIYDLETMTLITRDFRELEWLWGSMSYEEGMIEAACVRINIGVRAPYHDCLKNIAAGTKMALHNVDVLPGVPADANAASVGPLLKPQFGFRSVAPETWLQWGPDYPKGPISGCTYLFAPKLTHCEWKCSLRG